MVDDGSGDRTAAVAEAAPGPVTVLRQPPSGPAAARNLAVAHSSGRALAFCDADVFPTPGWLRAGVAALEGADLVQGHVLPDPEAALGPFDRTLWITSEVGLWETANLFATRRAVRPRRRLRGLARGGHRKGDGGGRLVRLAREARRRAQHLLRRGARPPRGVPPHLARVRGGAPAAALLPRDGVQDPRAAGTVLLPPPVSLAPHAPRSTCSSPGRWRPRSPGRRSRWPSASPMPG